MLIGIDASRAVVPRRTGTENYSLQVIHGLVAAGLEHVRRFSWRAVGETFLRAYEEALR